MGKVFCGLLVAGLIVIQPVYAESKPVAKKADEEVKMAERRKRLEEMKAELNGSEWRIQVKQQVKVPGAKPAFGTEDTLTFQNGQFRSKSTEELGYTPTNYTLTVQDKGPSIWETMQTSSEGEITFWRGEWIEKVMSGVMTRQVEEGKTEEYSFSVMNTKRISPTSAGDESKKEEVEPAKAPEVLSSTPVSTLAPKQTSKKKKAPLW